MRSLINWFKNLFGTKKKSTDTELEQRVEEPLDPANIEKIAIVVGHTGRSKGALNYRKESEYDFNKRIAKLIKEYLDNFSSKTTGIILRDGIGRSGAAKKCKEWGADLTLELHFNSFRKIAYGCEVLCYADSKHFNETVIMADELTDDLAKEFKLGERHTLRTDDGELRDGVKVTKSKDRGGYNLRSMNDLGIKYSMLIEPCFANYKTPESEAIFENERKYAETIAEYLVNL